MLKQYRNDQGVLTTKALPLPLSEDVPSHVEKFSADLPS